MKFLLPATLAVIVCAQEHSVTTTGNVFRFPIVEYVDPIPEIKIEQKQKEKLAEEKIIQTEPKIIDQNEKPAQFVPENQPTPQENQDKDDLEIDRLVDTGGEEVVIPIPIPQPMPMPGSEEFNPFPSIPEVENQDRKHERKSGKKHDKKHGKKHGKKHMRGQQNMEETPEFSFETEQKHLEEKHRRGEYRGQNSIPIFSVALIFTLIGLLLGKCIFRIRKCGMRRCRNAGAQSNRNANQIHEEIKLQEQKINQLRAEYQSRRASEDTNAEIRNEEAAYRAHEMELIQRIQPQRMPQQAQFHNDQVPMRRPNYYQAQ